MARVGRFRREYVNVEYLLGAPGLSASILRDSQSMSPNHEHHHGRWDAGDDEEIRYVLEMRDEGTMKGIGRSQEETEGR